MFSLEAYLARTDQELTNAIADFMDSSIVTPPTEIQDQGMLEPIITFQKKMLQERLRPADTRIAFGDRALGQCVCTRENREYSVTVFFYLECIRYSDQETDSDRFSGIFINRFNQGCFLEAEVPKVLPPGYLSRSRGSKTVPPRVFFLKQGYLKSFSQDIALEAGVPKGFHPGYFLTAGYPKLFDTSVKVLCTTHFILCAVQ